jgi:hypothetical protein
VIDDLLVDERDARRAAVVYLAHRARAGAVLSKT